MIQELTANLRKPLIDGKSKVANEAFAEGEK
jgi:hypothetical protein